jgi:hypothetical protein
MSSMMASEARRAEAAMVSVRTASGQMPWRASGGRLRRKKRERGTG